MTTTLKLAAVLALLLGIAAPAAAEEASPAQAPGEKAHVHKDGDGHDHGKEEKDTKDHDHKDGDGHDHGHGEKNPQ